MKGLTDSNENSLLRAVIYARVSTGEQAENGTSLGGQIEACRVKAAAMSAEVVSVYKDAGVSGAIYHSRPGIQAALHDLEEGKADAYNCQFIAL